jgi:hypothetical protein
MVSQYGRRGRVTVPSRRLVLAERQPVGPNETGVKNIYLNSTGPGACDMFITGHRT